MSRQGKTLESLTREFQRRGWQREETLLRHRSGPVVHLPDSVPRGCDGGLVLDGLRSLLLYRERQ